MPPDTSIAKSGHLLTHQSQRVHSIGFNAMGNPFSSSTNTFCSHNSIQIWQRLHHLSNTCMVIWGRLLFFFFKRYLNFVFLDNTKILPQLWRSRKKSKIRRPSKKIQMQGAQIRRNEAYLLARCNEWGCSATQQRDFLRSRQLSLFERNSTLSVLKGSRWKCILFFLFRSKCFFHTMTVYGEILAACNRNIVDKKTVFIYNIPLTILPGSSAGRAGGC